MSIRDLFRGRQAAPKASTAGNSSGPDVAQLRARAQAATTRLGRAEADLRFFNLYGQEAWDSSPSGEQASLKAEISAAKKELSQARKAFKKATGKAFVHEPPPRPASPQRDHFEPAGGTRPQRARRAPDSPRPSPGGRRQPTGTREVPGAGAAAASHASQAAVRALGDLWAGQPFPARVAALRAVETGELVAIERGLVERLRRDPLLHRALGEAVASASAFKRALAGVHTDKNKPQAEREPSLFGSEPGEQRAASAAYLAKLDVARNILNAGRALVEADRFPALLGR